jgi:hypothetical protein
LYRKIEGILEVVLRGELGVADGDDGLMAGDRVEEKELWEAAGSSSRGAGCREAFPGG